jgi:two-component system, cell cycle sensor histidine kinase and response regulator CckA
VLVVEDDADIGQLVYRYLHGAGYEVELAVSPEQALDVVRERAIDLLVTDIVMPNLGGGELAQRVRELHPEIHVLYISGYPDDAHPRVADSVFLQKPFTRQSLIREVSALFDR